MTREQAIDLLSMIEFEHAECCLNTWYKGIDEDMKEALEMAIRALEQEPVLDKIRDEIEQVSYEENKVDEKWAQGLKYALKIIDKYRTESEVRK